MLVIIQLMFKEIHKDESIHFITLHFSYILIEQLYFGVYLANQVEEEVIKD